MRVLANVSPSLVFETASQHRAALARSALALLVSLLILVAGLSGCSKPAPPAPEVDPSALRNPPAGDLVGMVGKYGSHEWRGIPFAVPPVDERRWRKPAAAPRWEGTLEAIRFGSPCAQVASPFAGVVDQDPGTFAGDEDCLYLNVYAPRMSADELARQGAPLPVMVWLHGGGNSIGHASFYDGGNLAASENVVVVTTNYRLGPLGWMRHAALRKSAEDPIEASGNFGLLDQMRALAWVQENIAAFGGDPGNVTIFGESAGGRDVVALLLSPVARGLFHRAVVQSGSTRALHGDDAESWADAEVPGSHNSSNEIAARLLVRRGDAADREEARAKIESMTAEELEAHLRSTSAEELIFAYATDRNESIPDVPNVFADGLVLPEEPPLELFASGRFNHVPVIFGTNRDENRIFLYASPEHVQQWLGFLPRFVDEERFEGLADGLSAAWKLTGADAPADALLASGWPDVWVYRWDWDEGPTLLGADLSKMIGAAHGFEIPFVFGHFYLGPAAERIFTEENEPGREALSAAMMGYWANFARTGRPARGTRGDLPEWKPWQPRSTDTERMLVLDTGSDGGVHMSAESVSADAIVASVVGDPRLAGTRQCDDLKSIEGMLAGAGRDTKFAERHTACAADVAAR